MSIVRKHSKFGGVLVSTVTISFPTLCIHVLLNNCGDRNSEHGVQVLRSCITRTNDTRRDCEHRVQVLRFCITTKCEITKEKLFHGTH